MNSHACVTPSARPSFSDRPRLSSAVLVLFLAAMCFLPPATAATFNVSDAAGLRAALSTASTNVEDDVIVLAGGTYATGGTTFTFRTIENNTLTLRGANGTTRDQVVLDGGGNSQVLDFSCLGSCGAITLRGLTVQGGNSSADGGGVRALTSLTLADVSFAGNHSVGSGGAISGNAVTVTNSTFSGNTATIGNGGAIFGGTVVVGNSTFSNNTATYGGAINADIGVMNVANSTFSNNTARSGGGAISGNVVTVTNSLFSNNSATSMTGGAIYQVSPQGLIIIVNNTFSGNSAIGAGAAIYAISTSSIINSVFYGHSTPAIYAYPTCNLYNNLIDTSTGIAGSNSIFVGNVAPGAISPFVDAANGNFRLVAGSLAVNAGLDPNSTTFANLVGSSAGVIRQALLTDLQGKPRPTPGTAVDIGAYEFVDNESPTVPTGLSATAVSPSQINLAWTASTDNVGVTAYKVYRGGVLIATLGNVTSYSNTGLAASTAYSYTVQACDAAGNCSAQSAAATATTVTCTYSLFPTSQSVAANATIGTLSVIAASGCAWTASSNVDWITITSGSSGSGNGTVVYSVAANTGIRSSIGTLTIAGQTFTVTQAGLTVPAFISQSDCLFNWAEINYPNWFAPAGAISNTLAPYYYRYYPQTNAYLGTSSADNHVYYFGPLSNNSLFDVGALSPLLSTAGCQ